MNQWQLFTLRTTAIKLFANAEIKNFFMFFIERYQQYKY